jgi:hypothetical protein
MWVSLVTFFLSTFWGDFVTRIGWRGAENTDERVQPTLEWWVGVLSRVDGTGGGRRLAVVVQVKIRYCPNLPSELARSHRFALLWQSTATEPEMSAGEVHAGFAVCPHSRDSFFAVQWLQSLPYEDDK